MRSRCLIVAIGAVAVSLAPQLAMAGHLTQGTNKNRSSENVWWINGWVRTSVGNSRYGRGDFYTTSTVWRSKGSAGWGGTVQPLEGYAAASYTQADAWVMGRYFKPYVVDTAVNSNGGYLTFRSLAGTWTSTASGWKNYVRWGDRSAWTPYVVVDVGGTPVYTRGRLKCDAAARTYTSLSGMTYPNLRIDLNSTWLNCGMQYEAYVSGGGWGVEVVDAVFPLQHQIGANLKPDWAQSSFPDPGANYASFYHNLLRTELLLRVWTIFGPVAERRLMNQWWLGTSLSNYLR